MQENTTQWGEGLVSLVRVWLHPLLLLPPLLVPACLGWNELEIGEL
jgi:hypothetical protein